MTIRHPQIVTVLGLAALSAAFLFATGVSVPSSLAIVVVFGVQAWGGWAIWRSLRSSPSGIETIGMAIAVGTALSALSGVILRLFVETTIGWLIPAVIGLALMLAQRRSEPRLRSDQVRLDGGVLAAIAFGLIAGISGLLLISIRSYPLSWEGSWGGYHGDMLFFEALGSSLAGWGPAESIFSPDVVIRYHWLVYGWTGFLADSAGAEPFVALTRVVPFITLVAAVTIAAGWTRRLTSVTWAPILAVALIVTGGYVGASYGTILNFDSPSTSMTTVWLMAGVLIALQRLDGSSMRWPSLVLVGLLAAATTAGKVSTGFLLIAALGSIALIAVIRRTTWRADALLMVVTSGLSALLAYALVIFGSADPGGLDIMSWIDRASSVQGLNPVPGQLGAILGTVILALAVTARWAGALLLVRDPATRWSPMSAAIIGLALGGLVPLLLVSGGVNETWFALSASAPLSVFSAAGIGRWASSLQETDKKRARSGLMIAIGSAAVLWLGLWFLWNSGPSGGNVWEYTLRWAGPVAALAGAIIAGFVLSRALPMKDAQLGFIVFILVMLAIPSRLVALGPSPVGTQPGTRGDLFGSQETFAQGRDQEFIVAWSDAEHVAGQWLRLNTSRDSLIATNHTFSPLVAALSGRQTFVSGMHYQAPYGLPGNVDVLVQREAASWAFIESPSIETWLPLCEAGVTHMWIDPRRTAVRDWEPWALPVLQLPEVIIAERATRFEGTCD